MRVCVCVCFEGQKKTEISELAGLHLFSDTDDRVPEETNKALTRLVGCEVQGRSEEYGGAGNERKSGRDK